MTRVLVTGGHGWIGRAVCRELEARGDDALAYDHVGGYDVLNLEQLRSEISSSDGVINLAGLLGTAELIGAERAGVEVNITGALNVFDAAAECGVPVVQIGTGHKGQLNPYAITKGAAEDLALCRAIYRDELITVVRAYHVYGPGQKMCPPHGTATVRKIIPSFVCRALTGMDLEVYGNGAQLIDLVYVDDVARILVDALAGPYGRVFEAGTGKATTVKCAAEDVLLAVSSSSRVTHLSMRSGEPEESRIVADEPLCLNPWPYRLVEVVESYRVELGL